MMRSNSEGLERLQNFIIENRELFDSAKLFELEDIYLEINNDIAYYNEDFKWDIAFDIESMLSDSKQNASTEKMADELDDLFTFADIDEKDSAIDTIEELHGKAREIFEKYQNEEEDASLYSKIEEIILNDKDAPSLRDEMLKMIKIGYTFNCDYGMSLMSEVRRDTSKIEAEKEMKEIESNYPLPYATVKEIDFVTYSVQNYEVDATYSLSSEKVTGKGSRKLKEEIIQTINMYIEHKKKYAA